MEFLKENQEVFKNALPMNMGQILSIPFIIIGLYFVFRKNTKPFVGKTIV
jgi:prolipoprotein diacylglyceryltransferase